MVSVPGVCVFEIQKKGKTHTNERAALCVSPDGKSEARNRRESGNISAPEESVRPARNLRQWRKQNLFSFSDTIS